ncbi:3-hydroxyacyl-CoA dehydrogenase [Taklimakanibacter deserti]|uniref:3-hydroxyacyl-CoA dehydrogenase n=1 Tax=Taklimakanibacter deserti TaxID=2267839 RepID=UPI000E6528B5
MTRENIAVIGAGSIGLAWAIAFARAGLEVRLFDPQEEPLKQAMSAIAQRLERLREFALIDEAPPTIAARIKICGETEAVRDAVHVQENAPENLELKRRLMRRLDQVMDKTATLASSTSAIPAAQWADDLPGRGRCLVIHPANPPYLIPVVELVPAGFTQPETLERARDLMIRTGLKPVVVRKEIEGFVFNRLQGALLREAYCLVRDDVASVEDIDTIVREGLGLRWSFMGPFETAELNTKGGIEAHAERMGPAYRRMGAERGQDDPWTPDLVAKVASERRALLPLEDWPERVLWRDEMLMRLLAFKRRHGR